MKLKKFICPKCKHTVKETIYIKIEKLFCKKCNREMVEVKE